MQAEQTLLRLGRSLYRLDQVDSIAARHIQELRRDHMLSWMISRSTSPSASIWLTGSTCQRNRGP